MFPLWSSISSSYKSSDEKYKNDTADDAAGETRVHKPASENEQALKNGKATRASSTNSFNNVSTLVNVASAPRTFNDAGPSFVPLGGSFPLDVNDPLNDPLMLHLEDTAEFKIQKVWTLVNLPYGKKAIGTKWVYRNKKDERGIVVRNKARLVAQGYKQEEGIDYDEVFSPVARIEAIRLFFAYASFMNVLVYQMDVKSAFLYGTIEEGYMLANLQTKIHVDNESAICVVKNLDNHSKTKHIEIRHHFIRDSYEKKLIEMVKIHTDYNVADLLTKAFDVTLF
ncbi:copia protein [Tanacetum coccineum]